MTLDATIRPSSIAVVGGSLEPTTWGGRVTRNLRRLAPSVDITVVNRRQIEADGIRCVTSMDALDGLVEQVLIAAPAPAVPDLLRQSAAVGVTSAVVFSSGFGESTAADAPLLEARLRDAIAETGLAVLGPNCLGYNTVLPNGELLAATSTTVLDVVDATDIPINADAIAIATQSGGIGAITQGHLLAMGYWPASVVHTGNEYGVSISDVIGDFVNDERLKAIGLYLEGIGDPSAFERYATSLRAAGKQLIAMVGGRSDAGSRAVQSHSGRLVANGRLIEMFAAELGVPLVRDMYEFAQALAVSARHTPPSGGRLAILTASGGFGTLAADVAADHGLAVPELSGETQRLLSTVLPSFASARNPIDVTGQVFRDPASLASALRMVANDPSVDAVVITLGSMEAYAEVIVEGIVDACKCDIDVPVLVSWPLAPSWVVGRLREAGVAAFPTVPELMAAVALQRSRHRAPSSASSADSNVAGPVDRAARLLREEQEQGGGANEASAKGVLQELQLPVPVGRVVVSREQAVAAVTGGGRSVFKGHGSTLVHKAELGLVVLDVSTAEQAISAFDAIAERMGELGLDVSVLVEAQHDVRLELLVGWSRSALGTTVIFGSGGSGAEQIGDTAIRFAPISSEAAVEMMRETVAGRVLMAQHPESVDSIADSIVQLGALASAIPDLDVDLDVNPLAVLADGTISVLDACFSPRSAIGG